MYTFGVGALFAKFRDGTSVEFGTLQDTSLDFSFDKKELYGRKQYPVHVARGKGKIEGKSTYADIKAANLNAILGGTVTTGQLKVAEPVTAAIPSSTPFTLTITPPTAGTLNALLAVYDCSGDTKVPMKLTSDTPTTGQYKFVSTTKTLTFAEADAGKKIQYQYDYTLATGKTLTLTNNMMGTAPTFEVEVYTVLDGKSVCLVLNKCTSEKLTLNLKNEDYTIPDFSFSAFANASDEIGKLYLDE